MNIQCQCPLLQTPCRRDNGSTLNLQRQLNLLDKVNTQRWCTPRCEHVSLCYLAHSVCNIVSSDLLTASSTVRWESFSFSRSVPSRTPSQNPEAPYFTQAACYIHGKTPENNLDSQLFPENFSTKTVLQTVCYRWGVLRGICTPMDRPDNARMSFWPAR